MRRPPPTPITSSDARPRDEQRFTGAERRKQWRERLLLGVIVWPSLIYFTGIFDHLLVPVFQGTAPAPAIQLPSIIALVSSIPLCFVLAHAYQRERREHRKPVSAAEATRAATYSVFVMIILNLITHLSRGIRDIVLAVALTIAITLCIVLGFALLYLLFHPPLDTDEP